MPSLAGSRPSMGPLEHAPATVYGAVALLMGPSPDAGQLETRCGSHDAVGVVHVGCR